jgi:hypothetical protein
MTGEDKMKVKVGLEVTNNFQNIAIKPAGGHHLKIAKNKDVILEALDRKVLRVKVLNKQEAE